MLAWVLSTDLIISIIMLMMIVCHRIPPPLWNNFGTALYFMAGCVWIEEEIGGRRTVVGGWR